MDSTRQQKMNVVEDFDPSMDWVKEPLVDTLRVYIPGFRKEQLKVQVTSSKHLRISGERQLADSNRSIRFHKEIPIASNYDPNAISARFDKGILLITHPKIIAPAPEPQVKPQPPTKPPRPPQTATAAVEPQKPQVKQARPPAEAPKPLQPATEIKKPQEKQWQSPSEASKPLQPAVEAQRPQEKERQPAGETPKSQEKPPQLAANAPKAQEPTLAPAQPPKLVDSPPPPKPEEEKKKEKQENESYNTNTNSGCSLSEQLAASGSKYKKVLSDAVMEIKKKNPRDLINRVMVILIVIIAIYAMKLAVHQFDRKSHEN